MPEKRPQHVVGILLAAGSSTRFGSPKLLRSLENGIPLALRSAQNLLSAIPYSVAVIRKGDKTLRQLLSTTNINIIENPDAAEGISTSIVCGIQHHQPAAGWVIALADMPYIPAQIIGEVANAVDSGASIAAPRYKNRRGHPVGFARHLASELLKLRGDSGAKAIIDNHNHVVQFIDVEDDGVLRDIDKPTDIYPKRLRFRRL